MFCLKKESMCSLYNYLYAHATPKDLEEITLQKLKKYLAPESINLDQLLAHHIEKKCAAASLM
jgi:hypothetical protein